MYRKLRYWNKFRCNACPLHETSEEKRTKSTLFVMLSIKKQFSLYSFSFGSMIYHTIVLLPIHSNAKKHKNWQQITVFDFYLISNFATIITRSDSNEKISWFFFQIKTNKSTIMMDFKQRKYAAQLVLNLLIFYWLENRIEFN